MEVLIRPSTVMGEGSIVNPERKITHKLLRYKQLARWWWLATPTSLEGTTLLSCGSTLMVVSTQLSTETEDAFLLTAVTIVSKQLLSNLPTARLSPPDTLPFLGQTISSSC